MRNLFQSKSRKYFRRARGMAYDERGPEVKGPWRATSFVEAKIELSLRRDTSGLSSADLSIARDAFLEGRWSDVRAIVGELTFTITGTYGAVCSERDAIRESKQRYEGILDELGESLAEYNERSGNNFRSEARAEMQMWRDDGDCNSTSYPGLDVHDTEYRTVRRFDKNGICVKTRGEERVLVTEGCGCVHDEIAEVFPEFKTLIPWHLNTMRPTPTGEAWAVEELPDSVLEAVRALVLADESAEASERAA